MKPKSLLTFFFKKTPARLAFAITFSYGLAVLLSIFLGKNAESDIYFIILLPVFAMSLIFGCGGGFWGSYSPNCISNGPFLFAIIFGIIFLFFWGILKIIFLLNKS